MNNRPCPACGQPLRFVLGEPVAHLGAHFWCSREDAKFDVLPSGEIVPFERGQRVRAEQGIDQP
jgi:hypothetical protein